MKGNWENEKAKLRIDPSFSSETFFLWSTILLLHFFFSPLFSFSNKLPIAIEIPDESHRLILSFYICVSRSTLLSSKTLPAVSKQSSMHTQGNEVMHLELCNFVLIETKLRCKYILSSDYIRIHGETDRKNNISNRAKKCVELSENSIKLNRKEEKF